MKFPKIVPLCLAALTASITATASIAADMIPQPILSDTSVTQITLTGHKGFDKRVWSLQQTTDDLFGLRVTASGQYKAKQISFLINYRSGPTPYEGDLKVHWKSGSEHKSSSYTLKGNNYTDVERGGKTFRQYTFDGDKLGFSNGDLLKFFFRDIGPCTIILGDIKVDGQPVGDPILTPVWDDDILHGPLAKSRTKR